ncbi:MAG: hypothetical protein GTO63_18835 [Anaerolineae bacterium]|nr:hypothetical protein [Anaerolineae bacterium]NIN96830.1 hypothetical protein [Anaerolineae bacterium]NIQ79811.1 hypothetical protein [Anaerolineae bacterium]
MTTNLASAGRILPKRVRAGASTFLRDDVRRHIDFRKSRAYVLGHDISFGGIYLQTPQHREPSEAEPHSDRLRQQVLTAAARLQSELGDTVSVQTFDSSEIYWGDCARLAPHIILTIDGWACAITEQHFDGPVFKPGPYSNRYTGSHRMNGVFLAHGPDIKKSARLSDAKIYDVAPTILHIFGVAIPTDMDGRVLREIFDGTSELAMREVSYSEAGRPPLQTPPPSEEDDQRVREHLRGLGYLE